jgi:3-phosphoshikimate 1-carboxyvinyltransferase
MLTPSPLLGTFSVPGDKSVSHRALMFSAIAQGTSRICGLADNADVLATRQCLEALGTQITEEPGSLSVQGNALLKQATHPLDAANSGTTIRLMSGILGAQSFTTTIAGDESLSKRPMGRILEPLQKMGIRISSIGGNNFPPLQIDPAPDGLSGIDYRLPIASAQVKSAILLAGLYAQGQTILEEPHPSRDHTERMLRYAGIDLQQNGNRLILPDQQIHKLRAREWEVPGDSSSAAFLAVAALCIPGSEIRIQNVGLNPGRIGFIEVLRQAGANIQVENEHLACGEPVGDLVVKASALKGDLTITAEQVPALIDELPILSVAGLFVEGSLTVEGAEELRHKESDRIQTMAEEFAKLGYAMETRPDGFRIVGTDFRATAPQAMLSSHQDHRIAMSLMTLNRIVSGTHRWEMEGREWMNVSFPAFETLLFESADNKAKLR